VVRLVQQKFVALTLDGRLPNTHRDAETDFLLKHKVLSDGVRSATGYVGAITASGKELARGGMPNTGLQQFLEAAVKAFDALPPSELLPGAMQVPERGPLDSRRLVAVAPPPGALIVRVYNRQLMHEGKHGFRYTVAQDYIAALRDPKLGFVSSPTESVDRYREPGNDMMWVTKAEWQAMMPTNPRVGQRVPMPLSLCLRIFRFHLDPGRGVSEGQNFAGASAAAGKLQLTVEEVSPSAVRLRLDGLVQLESTRDFLKGYTSPSNLGPGRSQFNPGSPFGHGLWYKPRLLGYLAYDPRKEVFTRFDMVALGEVHGRPSPENPSAERLGAENPLGIAFELITDRKPADYLPPKGLLNDGGAYDLPRYLCLPKH
jgi:hypothetical protein